MPKNPLMIGVAKWYSDGTNDPTANGEITYVAGTGFRAYSNGSVITLGAGGAGSTFVALSDTPANYTAAANKILKVNAGATAVEFVTVGGDISIGATGTAAIAAGVIINADINAAAAIDWSKMAASSDISGTGTVTDLTIASEARGQVLFRDATKWTGLAVGSAGQALVSAGAGADPYWGAPSIASASVLANDVTCEAGATDYTLKFGTAGGAYNLTVPAVGGHRTFAFLEQAQEFTANQTFQYGHVFFRDNDEGQTLQLLVNENMTGDKTLTLKVNDTSRTIDLSGNIVLGGTLTTLGAWTQTGAHTIGITTTGATTVTLPTSGTLATLAGAETLEGKTLTTPKIVTSGYIADGGGDELLAFVEDATPVNFVQIENADTGLPALIKGNGSDADVNLKLTGKADGCVYVADGTDPSKDLYFNVAGATADKTMQIVSSQTVDRALTLPDATDTLVGKATVDIFTNKSFDCDGSGNALTNVNVTELDPVTAGTDTHFAIPFVIHKSMSNVTNAGANIYEDNVPFKMKILAVQSVCIGDTGTWVLQDGKVGALGDAITDVVTVAGDKDVDYAGEIDDAKATIAANSSLVLVGDGGGALDVEITITAIRVD